MSFRSLEEGDEVELMIQQFIVLLHRKHVKFGVEMVYAGHGVTTRDGVLGCILGTLMVRPA